MNKGKSATITVRHGTMEIKCAYYTVLAESEEDIPCTMQRTEKRGEQYAMKIKINVLKTQVMRISKYESSAKISLDEKLWNKLNLAKENGK